MEFAQERQLIVHRGPLITQSRNDPRHPNQLMHSSHPWLQMLENDTSSRLRRLDLHF